MENPFSSMSFQKIIDRIADAFSVFDFSYIISGGLTLLLVYMDIVILQYPYLQTVVTQCFVNNKSEIWS